LFRQGLTSIAYLWQLLSYAGCKHYGYQNINII